MRYTAIALATLGFAATFASAAVTDIDSFNVDERRFNDFPDSAFVTVHSFPTVLVFTDEAVGDVSGFANQHVGYFSDTNGASNYQFQNSDAFRIEFDITLDSNDPNLSREAGFRFDTIIGGEAFFIVKANGEVAAFGGPFPFFSFGGAGSGTYTLGTTARMGIVYTPGDSMTPATIEYLYNGMSSGPLAFSNTENGFIDNTIGGVYLQGGFDSVGDSMGVAYTNFLVVVPTPGTLALLGIGGLVAARRRR